MPADQKCINVPGYPFLDIFFPFKHDHSLRDHDRVHREPPCLPEELMGFLFGYQYNCVYFVQKSGKHIKRTFIHRNSLPQFLSKASPSSGLSFPYNLLNILSSFLAKASLSGTTSNLSKISSKMAGRWHSQMPPTFPAHVQILGGPPPIGMAKTDRALFWVPGPSLQNGFWWLVFLPCIE